MLPEAETLCATATARMALIARVGRVVLVELAGDDVKAAFAIEDVVNNDRLISASFACTSAAWAEVTRAARLWPDRAQPADHPPVPAGCLRGRLSGAAGRVPARGVGSSWT